MTPLAIKKAADKTLRIIQNPRKITQKTLLRRLEELPPIEKIRTIKNALNGTLENEATKVKTV